MKNETCAPGNAITPGSGQSNGTTGFANMGRGPASLGCAVAGASASVGSAPRTPPGGCHVIARCAGPSIWKYSMRSACVPAVSVTLPVESVTVCAFQSSSTAWSSTKTRTPSSALAKNACSPALATVSWPLQRTEYSLPRTPGAGAFDST